ncbi:MAG: PBP1A family penicillin-binding protein [Cyanobium sp.]
MPRRLVAPALVAAAIGAGVALAQTALVTGIDSLLPDADRISSFSRPGTLTILDTNGKVVVKEGPATREKLSSGKMPLLIQRAFVAAEDRRFYLHDGVDLVGISRAMLRNLSRGSVEEGASTITQQLARTVFLSQDRTLIRKLKEALLAGKIERQLSKEQILEQYLNFVYLGSSAYGVADAAWVYFSKTPDQLTLPEAALIAGLPPAPSVYSPLVNPDLALSRRRTVLQRMREAGYIDDIQLDRADAAPLGLKPAEPKYFANPAPWFTSWLEQELPGVLTKEQLEVGGLTIRSGLNKDWQAKAQETINSQSGSMQGALVAMEPGTGLVRAMVGGKDWNKSQFNRATQALRSPGSTFKLFTYGAAIKYGMRPEDRISARERCYREGWPPKSFCIPGTAGSITLLEAITRSINPAAVATAEKVGFPRVIGVARDLGITGVIGEYPAMVMGSNEKTMLEMVAAYTAVNNRGVWVKPVPFEEIYGPDGELLWSRSVDGPKPKRALSSDVADALMWMLQSVVRNGTGYAAALPDRPVAGKTGTAEGARDLWFIGSIPQLTTAVWFGYDENFKTGSSSAQAAAAWSNFMTLVTKGMPVQKFPPKPTLTGSFIPYVPPKHKRKPAQGQAVRQENWEAPALPDAGTNRLEPPPERDESRLEPPPREPSSWEPPAAPPPTRSTPEPAPTARPAVQPSAPRPSPAPAPVAAPPTPPPPISPPPPMAPPPPLP